METEELIWQLLDVRGQLTPGAIDRADLDGMAFTVGQAARAIETLRDENAGLVRMLTAAVHAAGGEIRVGLTSAVVLPTLVLHRHDDPSDGSHVLQARKALGD